jgi:hypothetical protein
MEVNRAMIETLKGQAAFVVEGTVKEVCNTNLPFKGGEEVVMVVIPKARIKL